jgi:hypothetical protein
MNIPIYKQEISDGLEDQIKNNSIACYALAKSYQPSDEAAEQLKKVLASSDAIQNLAVAQNNNQIDLYYINSILVSTGWNKNDDVFDPKELWEARKTPEDKPFNFMHNEKDIIGHITSNQVVDFDGNSIDDSLEEFPSEFNILTSAVIYTEWSDQEQRSRMQKIIAEIEDGKWFVSMECLFPNFDYALSNENETRIIARSEASAFLTKHLRAYGGDGKYEDYRVGRLLRNLSFSGKGLVSKPANPRSIILEGNDFFDESKSKVLSLSSLKENSMSESYEKQVEVLRAELAEAKAANEALKEKVIAEQQSEFETKIQSLEATIATQNEKIQEQASAYDSLSQSLKAAEEALAMKDGEMKEKEEELKEMKKKEAMMKRKAQLVEAGFDAEEASATIVEFENLDDVMFDKVVALMKKKAKTETKAEVAVVTETQEEIDSAEASEEVLDSVEAPSEVAIAEAMGEEDPVENLRSVATEWIGSVLKSSRK